MSTINKKLSDEEVVKLEETELEAVTTLYEEVTRHMQQNGSDQWDRYYPTQPLFAADLHNGHLYGIRAEGKWIGVVALNDEQGPEFAGLPWRDGWGRAMVIHRLAVHPAYQGHGIGKKLLRFAEAFAVESEYTSIRFDAYTANEAAIAMYEKAGYAAVGEIRYPFRKYPFRCYEKLVSELCP
ncbi:GNAT family N-acetyltransferase [Paenibacillus sp. H1-7]|uniref:GNAT family N-acetyltransferase n=1 Tax=Paenibacillus sp. H1-7 TaxID=2282849 RepID=UPI001EF7DFA8|nr:GNAT family N-acetyltransferase [Paenibacillus sp. H1-7]ULL15039.1 GNAT family N-acetyltransferase [Paenibacillus sp. H1-7]